MIVRHPDGVREYLFDRSRLETAKDCPRKYFWAYGFLDLGIVKNKEIPPYWPYLTGTYIHEVVENVLKGIPAKVAADKAALDYHNQVLPLITDPEVQPELAARLGLELDQEVEMVRGLGYGWSLVGLPRILEQFQIVEIEKEEEISWMVDGVMMTLMTRTDILAKSLASGAGVVFNLKSTKDANDRWRNTFSRDMQTLTEAMAVEARIGDKVEGVIIEGLVKGGAKEWPKQSGFWQYYNSLIYCWVKEASGDVTLPGEQGGAEYATAWDYHCTGPHIMGNGHKCPGDRDHTLGKGYKKRLAKDCFPGGTYAWIDYLLRHDPATLSSYFVQLPPITRSEFQVERWKRQKLPAEKARQDAADRVNLEFEKGDKASAYLLLDNYFEMFEGWQCLSCAYHNLCWEAGDPLDEGMWKLRTPNHKREGEELVRLSAMPSMESKR